MNNHDVRQGSEIPSFHRAKSYSFDVTKESFEIYRELSQIGEEIEQWRAANS